MVTGAAAEHSVIEVHVESKRKSGMNGVGLWNLRAFSLQDASYNKPTTPICTVTGDKFLNSLTSEVHSHSNHYKNKEQ